VRPVVEAPAEEPVRAKPRRLRPDVDCWAPCDCWRNDQRLAPEKYSHRMPAGMQTTGSELASMA